MSNFTWAIPDPINPPPITVTCLIASLLADVDRALFAMPEANAILAYKYRNKSIFYFIKGQFISLCNMNIGRTTFTFGTVSQDQSFRLKQFRKPKTFLEGQAH